MHVFACAYICVRVFVECACLKGGGEYRLVCLWIFYSTSEVPLSVRALVSLMEVYTVYIIYWKLDICTGSNNTDVVFLSTKESINALMEADEASQVLSPP